jgi:nicotinamidase-related amidase
MSSAATSKVVRAVGKVKPETSALLLIDVQERFRSLIWKCETVIQTCRYMTSVAKELKIPIVVSQQYTKVFGETVSDCFASPGDIQSIAPIYEKKQFSMCTDQVEKRLMDIGDKDSYIVVGIEAHVCVQQTCLDLLERGKDVHVIVDGVSSQQPLDREMAFQRLQQAGAYLTTSQSMAFMLMKSAEHPHFKTISKLTVEHMKLPNEFNDILKQT